MKLALSLVVVLVALGSVAGQANSPSRIQILKDGEVRLASESLATIGDLNPLKSRLAKAFQNGSRSVTIESDESDGFSDLLRVLRTVRDLGATPLFWKLADSDGGFTVTVPTFRAPDEDVVNRIPNPLTLVVRVDSNHRIHLNDELQRSDEELFARLREVLRQRKTAKAYRAGSTEVEATLFLKPYPGISRAAVIDLLRGLHGAGANPLGLQIDDLGDDYPSAQPNKSLHRSAGSLFLNLIGAAEVESNRRAR